MSNTGRRLRIAVSTAAAVALAATMAACSTTGSGNSTPASSGGASTQASCTTTATERLAKAEAAVHEKVPSAKVNVAALSGKTIWLITPGNVLPIVVDQNTAFQAAAQAAGVTVKIFDGQLSPQVQLQGVQEAVTNHAAAIILNGEDMNAMSAGITAAQAANIPVVGYQTLGTLPTTLDTSAVPVTGYVGVNNADIGRAQADYFLSHFKCTGDAVDLTLSASPALTTKDDSAKAEINSLCPTCGIKILQVDQASLPSSSAQLATSAAQSDPKLKAIISTDIMAGYVIPAIQHLGSAAHGVQVIGNEYTPPGPQYTLSGAIQTADSAYTPVTYQMWSVLDNAMRVATGQKPASVDTGFQFVTTSSLKQNNNPFSTFGNWQKAFLADWK